MKPRLIITAVLLYTVKSSFTAGPDDIHGTAYRNLDSPSYQMTERDADINVTPNLKRSSRLNLSTSLEDISEKFHINVNTIIRTQDSRSMGAKYLNETELPSNQDCLFWCWETPNCNVAVFEEKNKGSCYLFDCGSPADFRCKFTVHNFYTSSILLTNQHSYDLSVWGAQVKHENELARLHPTSTTIIPEVTSVLTSEAPVINSVATTEPSRPVPVSKIEATDKQNIEKRCRHYQFQCLNSSECIAIYNVCDGIPQCPDGSDESKDLQCPESISKASPSSARPQSPVSQPHKSYPPVAPQHQKQAIVQQPAQSQSQYNYKPEEPVGHSIPVPEPEPNLSQQMKNQMKVSWIRDYDSHQEPIQSIPDYSGQLQEGQEPHQSLFNHKHLKFKPSSETHQQYMNQYPDYDNHPTMQQADQYNPYSSSSYHRLNDHYPSGETDVAGNVYGRYTEQNPYWSQSEQMPSQVYKETSRTGSQLAPYSSNRQGSLSSEADMYLPARWPVRQSPQQSQYVEVDKHTSENEGPAQRIPQQQIPVQPHLPLQNIGSREDLSMSRDSLPDSQDVYGLYLQPQRNSHRLPQQKAHEMPLVQESHSHQQPSRDESSYISENMKTQPEVAKQTAKAKVDLYQPVVEEPVQTHPPAVWRSEEINNPSLNNNPSSNKGSKGVQPSTKTLHEGIDHKPAAKTYNALSVDQPSFAHISGLPEARLSVAEIQRANHIHAHESNSAVLALTLGLCITALLLVLVGCRMRSIRRRLSRRGRSSLTHDADYLVNGMYL